MSGKGDSQSHFCGPVYLRLCFLPPLPKKRFLLLFLIREIFFRFPKSVKISSRFLFTPSALLMLVFEFLLSFPLFSLAGMLVKCMCFDFLFVDPIFFTRTYIPIFFLFRRRQIAAKHVSHRKLGLSCVYFGDHITTEYNMYYATYCIFFSLFLTHAR